MKTPASRPFKGLTVALTARQLQTIPIWNSPMIRHAHNPPIPWSNRHDQGDIFSKPSTIVLAEHRLTDLRSVVVQEFKSALTDDVLHRPDRQNVNYFFLVTNVPASKDALDKVDKVRTEALRKQQHLHADVWWAERVTDFLDWSPDLWRAYPELFPGGVPPLLEVATSAHAEGLPRTLKLAIAQQYERDSQVKFRQIELEKRLLDLFVDLDFRFVLDPDDASGPSRQRLIVHTTGDPLISETEPYQTYQRRDSVLHLLLDDTRAIPRIFLEGGPGQGKSTITQMAAQIYREKFLATRESESRNPAWHQLSKLRVPIRSLSTPVRHSWELIREQSPVS